MLAASTIIRVSHNKVLKVGNINITKNGVLNIEENYSLKSIVDLEKDVFRLLNV